MYATTNGSLFKESGFEATHYFLKNIQCPLYTETIAFITIYVKKQNKSGLWLHTACPSVAFVGEHSLPPDPADEKL